jgi:hypothetical protein
MMPTSASASGRRLRRDAGACGSAASCCVEWFTASARANSPALVNRSAGVLASARATAASISGGTVLRSTRRCVGVSVISFAIIDCALAPVTGGSPASISYSTAASEYTSLRASMPRSPVACSGDMYCGVPSDRPVCVRRLPPASFTASAIPKSASIASPSWRRMFSGLMSRCTSCWRCA